MSSRRKEIARRNREALIEATLGAIAENGFGGASVTEIVARAGLSRGMIHLHFGSMDALYGAAAEEMAARYYAILEDVLAAAAPAPQARIAAMVESDMSEATLNRRAIRLWYAFRGEAGARPAVARHSDTRDQRLNQLYYRAFREIVESDGAAAPAEAARDATQGTLALLEGLWTDFLVHPDSFERAAARRIVFRFLSAMFPRRFALDGWI